MTRPAPRFANIFFSGPCNLACPLCVGREPSLARLPANLDRFPLAGLDRLVPLLRRHRLREVTLSGTNTDPLLYRPLDRLVTHLHLRVPGVRLNLHTNGRLLFRRLATVNRCHRVTLSIPSLNPVTYRALTGRPGVPDLARMVASVTVPLKVSVLVTDENRAEVPGLLRRLADLGIRRAVLRHPVQVAAPSPVLSPGSRVGRFAGNPVHRLGGLEVTEWIFPRTSLACVSLFSDGNIRRAYRLTPTAVDPIFPTAIKRHQTCHVAQKKI